MLDNIPFGYQDEPINNFPMPEEKLRPNVVYKSLPWHPRQNGTQAGVDALKASLKRGEELIK